MCGLRSGRRRRIWQIITSISLRSDGAAISLASASTRKGFDRILPRAACKIKTKRLCEGVSPLIGCGAPANSWQYGGCPMLAELLFVRPDDAQVLGGECR